MRKQNRERGSIFVITLVVLAGMIAILATISANQRVSVQAEINRTTLLRARQAALSGIQYSAALFANQQSTAATGGATAGTSNSASATTLQDDWATQTLQGNDHFTLGNTGFRLEIIDACSRININNANQETLLAMGLTQEQVDSLLDFREASTNPRAQGAKDSYYNGLNKPYNAKLAGFDSILELLNVRGFTARVIYEANANGVTSTVTTTQRPDGSQPAFNDFVVSYGFSPVIDAQGQAKINVNGPGTAVQKLQRLQPVIRAGLPQTAATQISAGANFPSIGNLCQRFGTTTQATKAILDYLVTSGATRATGKINLNTVSQDVLQTLPGITPDVAQGIISRQSQGFASLGDLTTVPGLNSGASLATVADLFTVVSSSFVVRVVGEAGNARVALEATIDVQNGTPRIVRIDDAPFNNMPTRWGWVQDTTNAETVLLQGK